MAKIILTQEVSGLGSAGDVVDVKNGYARNFLIPTKRARRATDVAIKEFEARRAELEKAAAEKKASAEARAAQLAELEVTITATAGDEGKLFGSVGPRDIAEALGVSVSTVKLHVQDILTKLQASDRTQAAVKALRRGLL